MENRIKAVEDLKRSKDMVDKLSFALKTVNTSDNKMIDETTAFIDQSLDNAINLLTKKLLISYK